MNSSEHAETCYKNQTGEAIHGDLNNSWMHAATVIYYTPYTMPAGRPAGRALPEIKANLGGRCREARCNDRFVFFRFLRVGGRDGADIIRCIWMDPLLIGR
jgi:hypothetical protein